jgi:hypothetical protein
VKKPLVTTVIGLVVLFAIVAAFALFWIRSRQRDIAEYLPPVPAAAGVSISSTGTHVYSHFAAREFRFRTGATADAAAAAKLFEPQLVSAGWQLVASGGSGNVFSSSWRHREKISGGLHLAFTVLQLDPSGEFLGTMTTVPSWPAPTSSHTP